MKYLVILTLVVSCATKEKKAGPEVAPVATTPTESEAKPVSPYTVKPCYCMKIYQPVCANGVNYGNSCEAECNGNKTWTEGNCAKK